MLTTFAACSRLKDQVVHGCGLSAKYVYTDLCFLHAQLVMGVAAQGVVMVMVAVVLQQSVVNC